MDIIETIFLLLAYVAVFGFFINGVDDLFFDTHFLVYLFKNRKTPHVTLKQLRLAPEQWVALFVPAWQEGGIVNKMAEYASKVVLYERYDIFIGVYPNDPETNRCVDEIVAQNPRIHKVVVPHHGPTSKADCLNWIYRAMRLNERPGTKEYQIIALHDAEDVLHPLLLKVYSFFVPRVYDMGQVPVFALELPLRYWTGNSYIDDFAELHTKDLFVRESIGGVVPSAGVGTAFARAALDRLAANNGGDPFFIGNLTEDYEVGIRLKRAGYRTGIINFPVDRVVRKKRADGTLGEPETVTEVVAVREAFPNRFWAAVRQRSRWITGISFQTWEQAGWAGTLPMRYTLVRDRRAPLTHFINMIGYMMIAYVVLQWLFRQTPWASTFYVRPLFDSSSLLWKFTIIDSWLLIYRGTQKFISVQLIYNFKQAVFSLPRVIVGNLINFMATLRAARMFLENKLFGKPIAWQKTTHVFPGEAELAEYSKTVEDLIIEEGLATREQILAALRLQGGASAPSCLLRMGLLDEQHFTEIWAKHSKLPVRSINPAQIPVEALQRWPERVAQANAALPVEKEGSRVVVGFREPPNREDLIRVGQQLGATILPALSRPSTIAYGCALAYPGLSLDNSKLYAFYQRVADQAGVAVEKLIDLLGAKQANYYSPIDVVVDAALLTESAARQLWAEFINSPPLGVRDFAIKQDIHGKLGAPFWWLHHMAPISNVTAASGFMVHPEVHRHVREAIGGNCLFIAELPGKIEAAVRAAGLDVNAEDALLEALTTDHVLAKEEVPRIKSTRQLIADPIGKWLLMQRKVTDKQLHAAFAKTARLPIARNYDLEEVKRLWSILPPGFAEQNDCFILSAKNGVQIGLGQLPSAAALKIVRQRLGAQPLFFQGLDFEGWMKLRGLGVEV